MTGKTLSICLFESCSHRRKYCEIRIAGRSDYQTLPSASCPDLETSGHTNRDQSNAFSPWSSSADRSQACERWTLESDCQRTTKHDHRCRSAIVQALRVAQSLDKS